MSLGFSSNLHPPGSYANRTCTYTSVPLCTVLNSGKVGSSGKSGRFKIVGSRDDKLVELTKRNMDNWWHTTVLRTETKYSDMIQAKRLGNKNTRFGKVTIESTVRT